MLELPPMRLQVQYPGLDGGADTAYASSRKLETEAARISNLTDPARSCSERI